MKTTLQPWIEATLSAGPEFAESFGLGEFYTVAEETTALDKPAPTALISILGSDCSAQFGIIVPEGGHERLAHTMLCLEDDEQVEAEDAADALREVANVIGGMVKGTLSELDPELQLSLPLYVNGAVDFDHNSQTKWMEVAFGDVNVYFVVALGPAKAAAA